MRRGPAAATLFLAALFQTTLLVPGALAAPATLKLGAAPLGPIRPLSVNGFNYGPAMPAFEFREQLLAVGVRSLRFPGGNVGDDRDLGPPHFAVLAAVWEVLGRPAVIVQARAFGGTPEGAARAARDALAAGVPVAIWEVGNEPDLYRPIPRADGTVGGRGDASWTPERYCSTFRAYRDAIRAVQPGARLAGPAVSKGNDEPGSAAQAASYLREFVRLCGDVVDLLTWHEYPGDGRPDSISDEAGLASAAGVSARIREFRQLLASPEANPLGYRRDISLGVTEYSLSWNSPNPRHLADQVGALWAAETTLRLADGGAELASYFALAGTSSHGLVDAAGIPRPSLYAFRQIRDYQGEAWPLAASHPALWAHAARDGNRLVVLLTNTDARPIELDPALAGWTPIGAKTFTEATVAAEADLVPLGLAAPLALPGRSLTRIVYRRQAR